ncbi:response regulator [Roseobacter sp. HKCCA0434]|uniref:response regulator n=1 Tax=Roseobacter sp. HKCCA0434 TaxID=3079297 RepID=UPI002905B233|nr:response regulator [Roseobacter sp. HKCCA0434]
MVIAANGPLNGGGASVSLTDRRILLVEDEGMLALDLELALEDAGARPLGPVMRVAQGLELLAADREAIDAAILDLDLHGEDVYPIADSLVERGVPFLFHTGHGRRSELQARYPDAPVFLKPSMVEKLLACVADLADG